MPAVLLLAGREVFGMPAAPGGKRGGGGWVRDHAGRSGPATARAKRCNWAPLRMTLL